MSRLPPLDADQLLYGYLHGYFPMAGGRQNRISWYAPDPRAIIPLETYRPPRSLRPVLNQAVFEVRFDTDFEGVMRGCAAERGDGEGTWISEEIIRAYTELHERGFAHSVESWQNGVLAGGLYGVSLGAAFFGESMFYRIPNASKVAFHHLVEHLRAKNFSLLDTQFINDNVRRFGAIEIPKEDYEERLREALAQYVTFF